MGVRAALASSLARASKALGGTPTPAEMTAAAQDVSQMGHTEPFAPGEPIGPYDGYSRHPRTHDFATGYNIATRPRTHERVSFDTLRGLIEAYDVAQIAIWHRIDSIRSLDWKLVAADGYSGDVTDAIATGMKLLARPDGVNSFEAWFAKWAFDVLAYDAGCLYRLRNRAGRVVGLAPVDGTTIAPLLDYWGNPPAEPAEAYVQYVNGLPWNWLTRGDLVYEPFRPRSNSPYGTAPLESIILNANTDIRFQVYFLQRFTEGNIPEAFASAPETWGPDQIEQFQGYWDTIMYGDQSRKHQIRWMPGGSGITWSNEKDFSDVFSLHLMRKSLAAYHVVPSDLGFTENVNRSSGESQADVQHRVGDLPFGRYAERILTSFLQHDVGLPLKHQFDWGEEQDDRYQQAQADQVYIDRAVVSASEIRQMRYGLSEPVGQAVPRVFFTERAGPIPLAAVYGVAGPVDPQTAAPAPGAPLPREAFTPVPGVLPNPALPAAPLAEQEYGQAALPPAPPKQQPGGSENPAAQVAKDGSGGPTTGITSQTGITSYDLDGRDEDEDREGQPAAVVKAELAAFGRFARARRKAGEWRDFRFAAVGPVRAHNLNDGGRLAVRKAAGEVAVAGLAVLAADTGRVLMLQRALGEDDPVGGTWEFPGGHCEEGETPLQAAWREWAEETGCIPPPGRQTGSWTAGDGIYQGFVWTVDSEASVPVRSDTAITNPDDLDGDAIEAIAWWDPAHLAGNRSARPELLASLDDVLAALENSDGELVAKAGDPAPKPPAPDGATQPSPGRQPPVPQSWPGWDHDLDAIAYWAPLLAAAFLAALSARELARAWLALGARSTASTRADRTRDLTGQARAWLGRFRDTLADAIADVVARVRTDGYAIGAASADASARAFNAGAHLGGVTVDMGGWEPGASSAARELVGSLGGGEGLEELLRDAGVTIKSIADTRLADLARVLGDGAERGLSAGDLADAVKGLLSDPSRAEMIVATELARAANSAAMWAYRLHGIKRVGWVSAEDAQVCPRCEMNALAGSRSLGEDFPSGDSAPPIHPWDRCALMPA